MGFRFKIFFMFFLFAIVLLALSLFTFNRVFIAGIKKQNNENTQRIVIAQENRIYNFLNKYRDKLIAVKSNVNVQKYIKTDFKNDKDISMLFESVLQTNPNIQQLRYIADTGMEIIRFEKKDKKIVKVDKKYLQDKSDRYYFKEIMKIKKDSIWYSKMDLNVEKGKIELPIKPVIRIAVKMRKGFMIANVCIKELSKKMRMSPMFEVFIIDKDGNFIFHKDDKYSFSKYLKQNISIHDEFQDTSKDILKKEYFSLGAVASKKLNINNNDKSIIIIRLSKEISKKRVEEFYNIFFIISFIAIVLSIVAAYFFARPIAAQARQLNETKELLSLKVKEKTKELQKYLDIINQYIIISTTDPAGKITYANEAFSKVSGYSNDELVGKPHNLIRHPDMTKEAFKEMWDTIKSGKQWHGRVKNLKKDGGYYWVDAIIEPDFNSDGEIESYTAVRVDITDKIALEELTQNQEVLIEGQIKIANFQRDQAIKASKTKSEFLANMSHEIRTPLNAILGFVDLLRENIKDKQNKEYLEIIDESSFHLLGIINDILDFSKIENGLLQIDKIDFDTHAEFGSIINLFRAKCQEKNIDFIVDIDENIPEFIHSDPLRIKQVISNLLSNAIKFTKKNNKIKIKIDFKNELLNVIVKDCGIGIAQENIEKIFLPFSQEDSSTTRKFGGTGLGLAISSELVRLLDGELKVKSKLGNGSKFYFSLPVEISKEVAPEKADKNESTFKGHVLLVEDNKANQMFMKVILNKFGMKYDLASDGIEAVEAFKEKKYDLILMDENMPNMNGIEATRHILEYEKQNNLTHTPIIALTANALKGDKERFLEAGMDEYLSKPLNKEKLNKILKIFL